MSFRGVVFAWFCLVSSMPLIAQPYSVRQTNVDGVSIVELRDEAHNTTVSVAPAIGNNAYQMLVNGKNVFLFPYSSVGEFAAKPRLCGNPFLAPWANRIDGDSYSFNGQTYHFNADLGNLRRDQNKLPIHGLLVSSSQWRVISMKADQQGAAVVSRLDFWQHADLMAQFPFAHVIEMEYRLSDGTLEVKTRLINNGTQPMPVAIGFHPYYRLYDAPRDSWTVHLAADRNWVLDDKLTPTGETKPIGDVFPDAGALKLENVSLDHVFGGLQRDSLGRAHFSVQGQREKIEVIYGPKYNTAVVYSPKNPNTNFICFEPMAAITNAFNLAQRGVYHELNSIEPGQSWEESYWIHPTGF